MTKLHKTIFRVNAISIKIPTTFYIELEQILKFVWKHKKAQTVKASGGEKGLRGSGAGTLGVPLGTTVLKQMPTEITPPWNTFQEIDCCEGEAFNINIKNVVEQH